MMKVSKANTLPNLIIAGVYKCGTTSLFHFLKNHPDICASRIKEPRYFFDIFVKKKMPSFNNYLKNFNHYNGEKYVLEGTAGYFFYGEQMAKKIKEILGDITIIVLLRNRVERLISIFGYKKVHPIYL